MPLACFCWQHSGLGAVRAYMTTGFPELHGTGRSCRPLNAHTQKLHSSCCLHLVGQHKAQALPVFEKKVNRFHFSMAGGLKNIHSSLFPLSWQPCLSSSWSSRHCNHYSWLAWCLLHDIHHKPLGCWAICLIRSLSSVTARNQGALLTCAMSQGLGHASACASRIVDSHVSEIRTKPVGDNAKTSLGKPRTT